MKPIAIALLAFDGMEALDFAGPFEVFTTAARVWAKWHASENGAATAISHCEEPLFDVKTVARALGPVQARAGLRVLPDADFSAPWQADLLLVPGGVVDEAMACPHTLDWVRRQHTASRWTASVCTGAFVLAAAGVLTQGRVTTHWEDQADLQRQFPALDVVGGVRWVEQGRVTTSAGISAGIAMSLHLVATMAQAQGPVSYTHLTLPTKRIV